MKRTVLPVLALSAVSLALCAQPASADTLPLPLPVPLPTALPTAPLDPVTGTVTTLVPLPTTSPAPAPLPAPLPLPLPTAAPAPAPVPSAPVVNDQPGTTKPLSPPVRARSAGTAATPQVVHPAALPATAQLAGTSGHLALPDAMPYALAAATGPALAGRAVAGVVPQLTPVAPSGTQLAAPERTSDSGVPGLLTGVAVVALLGTAGAQVAARRRLLG